MSENWKNKPTVNDLKKDFDLSKQIFNNHLNDLDRYKKYIDESSAVKNKHGLKKKKSTYTSKLIKKQVEWLVPNIESPILSQKSLFSLSGLSIDASKFSDKNNKILNFQWRTNPQRVAIINKGVRAFVEKGSCILKVGWKNKTKTIKTTIKEKIYTDNEEDIRAIILKSKGDDNLYNKLINFYNENGKLPIGEQDRIIEKEIVVQNSPTIEVRDNRAIIVDPAAKGDWTKVKFLIDIQETDYATLSNNKSYFNLEYIREYILNQHSSNEYYNATNSYNYDAENFEFSDLARKKVTMYEYWGYWDIHGNGKLESIVASWIGDKMVRLSSNPYPHNQIPYVVSSFTPVEDSMWGEPVSCLIIEDQLGLTSTMRAMQDITSESAIGQEFIDKSIFESPVERIAYENGETVWTRPDIDISKAIHKKTMEPVPSVMFDMKKLYTEHSTLLTGVSDEANVNPQVQQSASGVPQKLDAITNREQEILRRFTTMLEGYARLVLPMNKEYLLENDTIEDERIGNIEELEDDYSVSIEALTQTVADNKASKIQYLLHNNGGNMSPVVLAKHYSKTASLWGLDDLAEFIEQDANKPPTEQETMMQQLELERIKLENNKVRLEILSKTKEMQLKDAKIDEIRKAIEAGSIDAKIEKELAQSDLARSQSEKMGVQVDLYKQEFGLIEDGTQRKHVEIDHEYQHAANLEREKVRTDRELKLAEKKHENSLIEKDKEEPTSRKKNDEYIKNGTINNSTYDASDDVLRNILDKNSLDTSEYTDGKIGKIEPVSSIGSYKDLPDLNIDLKE